MASMAKLAKMVHNHLKGILAHCKSGAPHAFMEGLNSVFSATKTQSPPLSFTRPPRYHALLRGR
jgi:hypothetical protein